MSRSDLAVFLVLVAPGWIWALCPRHPLLIRVARPIGYGILGVFAFLGVLALWVAIPLLGGLALIGLTSIPIAGCFLFFGCRSS